jgi:type II secretory pathway pseudopilin PulG
VLEVLVVLAIVAAATAIGGISWVAVAEAFEDKPFAQVFREVVREARHQAYVSHEPVHVAWDERARMLRVFSPYTTLDELRLSDQALSSQGDIEVRFYPLRSSEKGMAVSGSGPRPEFASEPVGELIFHPSGIATGARIEVESGGVLSVLTLEPFSGGPIDTDRQPGY